jgi:DNA (cytosine-5)-methyltransferase 1
MPHLHQQSPPSRLNVLSLFSGCGGMDLGFEGGFIVHKASIHPRDVDAWVDSVVDDNHLLLKKTRFHTVFANDILNEARIAWTHNFARRGNHQGVFHHQSIVDLVKLHRQGHQVFPAGVDVVTGGFPCQDFSLAGKRNGFNSHKDHRGNSTDDSVASEETRGRLYMWMKEVVEITRPSIFVAENVRGLVNLSNVKQIIQRDFASAGDNGYIVLDPRVLHAADFGVPQSRERVIFIGIRRSALLPEILAKLVSGSLPPSLDPYPYPSHAYTRPDPLLAKPVRLADVLAHLPEPHASSDPSHQHFSRAKFMGAHCQGQKEVNLDGIAPTIRAEHHGNIEFRRLSLDHGGQHIHELDMGLPERRLSTRECALIQTFPPDFEFVIPRQKSSRQFVLNPSGAYKVIGNAVPPLLAFHLASRLQQVWGSYFGV